MARRRDIVAARKATGEILVHPATVLAEIDQQFPESLERLFELLRFPSVGTDPAHHKDCLATADWLVRQLKAMGFAAGLRKTTGQPLVVGSYDPPGGGKPPISCSTAITMFSPPIRWSWTSRPFEPQIRKGRHGQDAIFARGSADDKGQLMTFLEASRGWLKVHGSLPFRLTVMIEGDEESDPAHIDTFLRQHAHEFPVDAAFICDTGMWDAKTPGIDTRLRGCMGIEFHRDQPKINCNWTTTAARLQPDQAASRCIPGISAAERECGVSPSPASMTA